MKKLILLFFTIVFSQNSFSQENLKTEINNFVNAWHLSASEADFDGYFQKMAENSIFIGTDKTELWNKTEFMNFSKKYFDAGKAWDFKTIDRNIYFSNNSEIVWFDELLDTWMGVCRSSGVVVKSDNNDFGWQILHYQLSVTIDNDKIQSFIKLSE